MTVSGKLVREQIAAVAAKLVQNNVDLLDGCRSIVQLRGGLSEADRSDPDLLILVAVESELDDIPTGSARDHWEPYALVQKDQEAAEYLQSVREEVMRASQALMQKWG